MAEKHDQPSSSFYNTENQNIEDISRFSLENKEILIINCFMKTYCS